MDLDAKLARAQSEAAEIRERLAFIRGHLVGSIDALRHDKAHMELMRGWAWVRHGGALGERIKRGPDDTLLGVPAGWPEGTDADRFFEQWAAPHRARYMGDFRPDSPAPEPEGESSRLLRGLLDG